MSNEQKKNTSTAAPAPAQKTEYRCTAMYFVPPGVQLLWEGHNGRALMLTEAQLAQVDIFLEDGSYCVMKRGEPGKYWSFPEARVEVCEFSEVAG